MLQHVDLVPHLTSPKAAPVVFEGAQGLLLDQTIGHFPYVTRSNCGLLNVAEIMQECGMAEVEVFYMSRAYVTRHGAGPIDHQQPGPPGERFADQTNLPNSWQGTLRFGTLDIDVLDRAIRADLASVSGRIATVTPRLTVTCLDQIDQTRWVENGTSTNGSEGDLLRALKQRPPVDAIVTGRGPTRDTVSRLPAPAVARYR